MKGEFGGHGNTESEPMAQAGVGLIAYEAAINDPGSTAHSSASSELKTYYYGRQCRQQVDTVPTPNLPQSSRCKDGVLDPIETLQAASRHSLVPCRLA